MSHVRFDNLMSHYKEFGLCTRMYGNTKRQPAHTFSFNDISHLTTFITNFARAHGSPLPGRVPGHRDKVMILPADITKVFVYSKYKQACVEKGSTPVGRSKFYEVWEESLPHISISKPSTDLCFTCHQNSLALQKSKFMREEEKSALFEQAQKHLDQAKNERDFYNSQVEAAKSAWQSSESGKHAPSLGHYSYDFAQHIHFPYSALQTGPEFFKTARKCGIFGVCNDGKSELVMYLIDEAENPGKGADCVISMLDHYFDKYGNN